MKDSVHHGLWGLEEYLRPICDLTEQGNPPVSDKPLKLLVEPDGIEPTTSTMPLSW